MKMVFRGSMAPPKYEHDELFHGYPIYHRRHNGRYWEYGVCHPILGILWYQED